MVTSIINKIDKKCKIGTIAPAPHNLLFFGLNEIQDYYSSIQTNGDEKVNEIDTITLSRPRSQQLDDKINSIDTHWFSSINTTVGWLGTTSSIFAPSSQAEWRKLPQQILLNIYSNKPTDCAISRKDESQSRLTHRTKTPRYMVEGSLMPAYRATMDNYAIWLCLVFSTANLTANLKITQTSTYLLVVPQRKIICTINRTSRDISSGGGYWRWNGTRLITFQNPQSEGQSHDRCRIERLFRLSVSPKELLWQAY